MDIIKKIKPLKAHYLSITKKYKLGIIITLVSLLTFLMPHETFASTIKIPTPSGGLVFSIGDQTVYLNSLNLQLSRLYEKQEMQQELDRQLILGARLTQYLQAQRSPLASYAYTLIQLNNWKKILALSNAESGFCKHYPTDKSNCWGIGGSSPWYMGANLGEAVVTMNDFLNAYPDHSSVKYSQMTFKQMNGLYKQPPAQHWVDNNQIIYDQLTQLEQNL